MREAARETHCTLVTLDAMRRPLAAVFATGPVGTFPWKLGLAVASAAARHEQGLRLSAGARAAPTRAAEPQGRGCASRDGEGAGGPGKGAGLNPWPGLTDATFGAVRVAVVEPR